MTDIRIHTLRTIAKTPWGFMGYVATTVEDPSNEAEVELARLDNLRTVQTRLTPGVTFPGHTVLTPVADTTISVSETLVSQDPMGEDPDDMIRFDEYEIQYGQMA